MPYRANYPATVAEVIDANAKYKPETLRAVREFARSMPWQGTADQRIAKFMRLHNLLCAAYGKTTRLEFRVSESDSGSSHYIPLRDRIVLVGRLSVVTYLHEFGHALGKDERQTCRWSLNLFRRCFPRSFAAAEQVGHTLRRRQS